MMMLMKGKPEQLCSLPVERIFIDPQEKAADLEKLKDIVCQLNMTQFGMEFAEEFGIGQLMAIVSYRNFPHPWLVSIVIRKILV